MDLSTLGRFHVAPGCDPDAPETWVWEDRSADVNHTTRPAVRITGGRGDEVSQVEAGACGLEIDNAGGHYCTENPYGRWHGKLALGCPARWGTISGAEVWAANVSNGWGTPDVGTAWSLEGSAANWSATGGVGLWSASAANVQAAAELVGANARNGNATWVCSTPVIPTGSSLYFSLAARRTDSNSMIMFHVEFGAAGALTARIRRQHGGVLTNLASASVGSYSAGQRIKAEAEWDGQDLRLRVWPEAGAKPTAWSVTTTDNLCTGSIVGIHSLRPTGNTNVGAIAFSYDDLEVLAIELVGTVPKWPVRWDPTAQVSWAPIEIAGIVRWLGQDEDAVRSPMRRQISGYTRLLGYWPLEDGSDAKQAANVLSGGAPATAAGMNFGSDGPAGAASAASFSTSDGTSKIGGNFKGASTTAGWQISWSAKIGSLPATPSQMIAWWTSQGYLWQVGFQSGAYTINVVDSSGGTVHSSNVSFVGFGEPNQWITFRLKATASGGTVTAEFAWFVQGAPTVYGISPTFSGTVGALIRWSANGNVNMGSGSIGQVFAVTTGTDNLQSFNALRAFDGYVQEPAVDRVTRLCGEAGVPVLVEPGSSEALGAQKTGTLLDLLRDAEAADMGVLYEAGSSLGYRPRGARYNRAVDMTLAFGTNGDIADPAPEPDRDDQRISNFWTVARTGGSEDNASDPAHIALNRRRPKSTTINIASDARLSHHAGWRVHLGTWGEYRWPQITLMLTDRASLLAAWRGRPFGLRLTVSGIPSQGPIGSDLDLIVEGWSQEVNSDGWKVVLNCSPARPWDIGVYDDAGSRRDSSSTTLGVARDAVQTSWTFSTVNTAETWSTAAGDYPLDVNCGGEQVRVTAMGAVSGSGPYVQTATVQRSINTIVKAQAVDTPISLWRPVVRGL